MEKQGIITDIGNQSTSIEKIKASDRTRSHLIAPGNTQRKFSDMTELEQSANQIYATKTSKDKEMYEKDKANGFDVNDIESVLAFKAGYTPTGNTVLIKMIYNDEENKVGSLIIPDSTNVNKKAVVIVPGLWVTTLKKGDIITLKPAAAGSYKGLNRTFKNIELIEVDYDLVAGVFMEEDEFRKRNAG